MDPGELKVTNHLRLKANYSDGQPVGPYQSYFHPRGKNLTIEELLQRLTLMKMENFLTSNFFTIRRLMQLLFICLTKKDLREFIQQAPTDFQGRLIRRRKKFRTFHPIEIQIMNQHLFLRLMREE